VEWKARSNFSATAVQHIRQLAVLVAPAVQSNRELAALDQFAYRFNRLQFEQLVESLEQSVGAITLVLHDVLSPLATYVEVETGFQSFRKLHCDDATFRKYLIEKTRESSSDSWAVLVDGMAATSNEIFESDLVLRIPGLFETEHPLGRFKVLVPPLSDDTTHPTLALNKLHRRAVATLFSDAFLDLVRECFNMLLKDLGIRFSQKETTNVAAWFRAVEETAIKAGLTWAVASHRDDNDLLGNPNAVEIVRGLSKHVTEYTKNVNIKLTKLYDSTSSTKSVLEIVLPIAKLRVWLGVSREGFGVELTYASPWMTFLEHFVDIADATVVRIMASIELQRIQTESAQYQGLATVAVTTGTLIHQVTNMVKGMQGPISTLVDAFTVGKLQCEGEIGRLIALMSKSAKQLLELISPITNITKLDTHRPCRVLEAAVHAKSLFDMPLRQREIELKIMVDPEIEIDLPFHVAGFALANLVTNAIDALNGKGTIEIHAEDAGDVVYCHVSDDGPGVPASIRDRIFELGITTKQGSGGWGLYLVYRSLGENRCRIDLTNPGPGGTRFTIRFPKAKEEERI
jgi:signal transduction histidine kinase